MPDWSLSPLSGELASDPRLREPASALLSFPLGAVRASCLSSVPSLPLAVPPPAAGEDPTNPA